MSFEIVNTADRAGWLAARRTGVGASDVPAIMGISPWSTPFQVWASKVAELPEDRGDEAMRWGSILETVILDEWERETGHTVGMRGALIRSTDVPIMMATPDGLVASEGDPMPIDRRPFAVAEAKNISAYGWEAIPEHYFAQVQWQLAVTGYKVGYLIVLFAGRRLETFEVAADADYQTAQVEAVTDFWKLVEADEPPPTDGHDEPLMASLWPYHTEQAVEVAPDLAVELYASRSGAKDANSRWAAAKAAVKVILGEADTAVVGQQVIATWRTSKDVRRFLVKGESLDD